MYNPGRQGAALGHVKQRRSSRQPPNPDKIKSLANYEQTASPVRRESANADVESRTEYGYCKLIVSTAAFTERELGVVAGMVLPPTTVAGLRRIHVLHGDLWIKSEGAPVRVSAGQRAEIRGGVQAQYVASSDTDCQFSEVTEGTAPQFDDARVTTTEVAAPAAAHEHPSEHGGGMVIGGQRQKKRAAPAPVFGQPDHTQSGGFAGVYIPKQAE